MTYACYKYARTQEQGQSDSINFEQNAGARVGPPERAHGAVPARAARLVSVLTSGSETIAVALATPSAFRQKNIHDTDISFAMFEALDDALGPLGVDPAYAQEVMARRPAAAMSQSQPSDRAR